MAAAPQPPSTTFRGTNRQLVIPSCLLSGNDLRRLHRLLEQKAVEAANRQSQGLVQQPNQSPEQLQELRESVRQALSSLVMRIQTTPGLWVTSTAIDPLHDEQLPDLMSKIEFDSAFQFRVRFNNLSPNDWFLVTLDLTRANILDMGNEPMSTLSVANIVASDSTWANALWEELSAFFRERVSRRAWLHTPNSYNLLVMLLGFPLSFAVVYRLDHLMRNRAALSQALSVAMDVYIVLLVLFCFRVTFNYARWAFPRAEVIAPRQHIGVQHRITISALTVMIIGTLVAAILKLFGIG